MIADLKPYPEYKESGIPWSPELPASWKTERAKRLFTKMQREVRPEDEVVTCFRDGMVTLRKNRRLRGFTEATAFSGYQGIRKGDLVIHGMDAFAGAIGVSDSDGKGTPVYNVCKPGLGVVAGYYAHTLREMSRSQWILALAKGIRERSTDFRYEMFGNQFVPLPPPAEQSAIVRFLDHWNGRLEKAIRAKRRVIALLQEQKQAIIHRAVTRGLDPNVKLKDSGIPWLGKIPGHWDVRQVKRVASFITSGSRGWADFYSDEGLVFIQSGNLGRNMALNFSRTQHVRPPSGAEGERTRVCLDDILVCITGALTGNVVHVDQHLPGPSFINQHVALIRPRTVMVFPRFLAYALRSETGQSQFKVSEYGGTKQGLGLGDVKDVFFPLPSMAEQKAIVALVDSSLETFTTAIARYEREITLLREYRTRLTADVVTGKLDVRAAAAQLPEEAEEEPLPDPELPEEESELEEVEG
jgi:type I restriction enzyme S subunit